ncbi:MAG: hypothetical protein EA381_01090 [Planctomycetaceae bacterium]|nr:MAG: hypothetical protein EA381_01090 [Planctomycetaceae bacterium]
MHKDSRIQQLLQRRLDDTKQQRHEVLKRYSRGDWINIAPPRQIYDRLKRKGLNEAAEQVMRQVSRMTMPEAVSGEHIAGATRPSIAMAAPSRIEQAEIASLGRVVAEAVIGFDEIMPIRFVHRGSQAADAVGRVVIRSSRAANGTGFLVAPRLLLTNNHVLRDVADANINLLQLAFDEREHGWPIAPVEFRFQPDVVFVTSPIEELDFTLVAVEPTNEGGAALERFGWLPLICELGKAAQGQRVNIVHHPEGRPKQVTLRENFLALTLNRYLHYMTDTKPGSSGSPVFNDEWEVIALHRAAREITDAEEIALYRQAMGSNVPAGADFDGNSVLVNEGVRVSQIVTEIKRQLATPGPVTKVGPQAGPLLEQLLRAAAPAADRPLFISSASQGAPLTGGKGGMQFHSDGTAVWTIPLQVAVNLGGFGGASVQPGTLQLQPITDVGEPLTPAERTQLELFANEVNSQKSVLRALSYLQESREGPYLPEPADLAAAKADYYDDLPERIKAGKLDATELYKELNELISELSIASSFPESVGQLESLRPPGLESRMTLESDTLYARSRAHLYTWVDVREHRMMQCPYTGTIIAPEQLMLRDVLTQLGLEDLLPQRFRNNRYLNCEHIVPQSWFRQKSVPRADLHHLVAADGAANHYRSDCAFRQLDGAGELGPENRPSYVAAAGHKQGRQFFEPKKGKGLVARATLYFLIAHQGDIPADKYDDDALKTLVNWATAEPPSDFEVHRNETIFEVQGNRNPLIDFPEWIDRIDYSRGRG